jgi:hypothetical protein
MPEAKAFGQKERVHLYIWFQIERVDVGGHMIAKRLGMMDMSIS